MAADTSMLDYDKVPDSRPLRPPTVDERVRDLEVAFDARAREMIDLNTRLKHVEAWPQRLLIAVVTGALGMMATVAGSAWYLGSRLTATEAAVDALTARIERVEDSVDRLEDRTWQRTDTDVLH